MTIVGIVDLESTRHAKPNAYHKIHATHTHACRHATLNDMTTTGWTYHQRKPHQTHTHTHTQTDTHVNVWLHVHVDTHSIGVSDNTIIIINDISIYVHDIHV